MKSTLLTFLALALLATLSHGQTKGVLKNITGNTITESLTFPSGTTLTIAAGATINATGATITGFGSGGGPTALDDLTDVTITTVATNDFLVKGVSSWVNLTAANARTAMGLGTLATQSGTISDYLTAATAASTYQPLDSDLTSIAALTTTTHGRSLLTGADAAASRTALGLGTLATQSATISDYLTTATASSTYAPIASPTFTGTVTIPSGASISGYATTAAVASGYAPLAHNQAWSTITTTPTTLAGYGITDAVNNVSGGFNGLSGNTLVLTDASVYFEHDPGSGTTTSQLTIASLTAARTWTLPDATGVVLVDGSALNGSNITSGTVAAARLGSGTSITTKYLRGDNTWQTISGGGDALTTGTLDQFADVTQTATKTLAITESTTLAGGTHSGTNTGDQTTITGNAGTATALQTGRTINGTTFDGTANITVTAAAGTLTGSTLNATVTGSSLTSLGTIATGVWQGTAIADSYIASAATWNAKQSAITFGTGVQTALGVNIGSAGAPVLFNGAGGTPSSLTLTNASGLPIAGITASTSTALGVGSVELGHASDTTLARSSAGVVTVEGNLVYRAGGSFTGIPVAYGVAISDETTAITTGTAKITFRLPHAMTLTAVRLSLTTASSSGTPTVDINEAGSTILSTKLSCDASEKTSTTATTAAVISDTALADDAEMTIDIDTAGTGATGAKVWLIGTR